MLTEEVHEGYEIEYQVYEEDDFGRGGWTARRCTAEQRDLMAVAQFAGRGRVNVMAVTPVTIARGQKLVKDDLHQLLAEGRRQLEEARREKEIRRLKLKQQEAEERVKELTEWS